MKKFLWITGIVLIACVTFAANGYFRLNSDGTVDVIVTDVEAAGDVRANTLSVTGTVTVAGAIIGDGLLSTAVNQNTATAYSVTNGASIDAATSTIVVTGIGGANDTTNTITLAGPDPGYQLQIVVGLSTTNLIKIADTTKRLLDGDFIGDAGDTLTLVGVNDSWVEIGRVVQ